MIFISIFNTNHQFNDDYYCKIDNLFIFYKSNKCLFLHSCQVKLCYISSGLFKLSIKLILSSFLTIRYEVIAEQK